LEGVEAGKKKHGWGDLQVPWETLRRKKRNPEFVGVTKRTGRECCGKKGKNGPPKKTETDRPNRVKEIPAKNLSGDDRKFKKPAFGLKEIEQKVEGARHREKTFKISETQNCQTAKNQLYPKKQAGINKSQKKKYFRGGDRQ